MKRLLFLRPEAERDLTAARDWYDQKRLGLGDEFLDAVALALLELEAQAEIIASTTETFDARCFGGSPTKFSIRSSATAS